MYHDDKSGVVSSVYTPDPKDPMNTDSNSTKPIEELQDSLKAEISRNVKTEILNLEPDEEQQGHYAAPLIPDVESTYKFRIIGYLSGNSVSIEFSSSHGAVSKDTIVTNSAEKISDTVTKNRAIREYACPSSRSAGTFPRAGLMRQYSATDTTIYSIP